MKKLLNFLRKYDSLYVKIKRIYGMTIGLHWLKTLYVKEIGFYNGKRRVKLINDAEANIAIAEKIKSRIPFMAARYGSTEFRNIIGDKDFDLLCFYSGFFPQDESLLKRFRKEYFESSKQVDFLSVWNYKNHFFKKQKLLKNFPNMEKFIDLGTGVLPWHKELQSKRLLVIHPFKKTIEHQYKKIDKLKTLPKLKSLQVIKAVQTLGDNDDKRFETWFDALDYMKKEIDKMDFDIAIIGCGAYGFPLAAYIKSIGKQAVHLGGCTQLLFGIKGGRWDNDDVIKYDEHWISPMKEDFLDDHKKIEGGCYW